MEGFGSKMVALGWRAEAEVAWARGGEPRMEVSELSVSLSMSAREELRWEEKAGESRQDTSCEAAFRLADEAGSSAHTVLWDLMHSTFLCRKAEHCGQVL